MKRLALIVKGCVSAALLAYVLSRVDVGQTWRSLRSAAIAPLGFGMLLVCLQPFLSTLRWSVIIQSIGQAIPFGYVMRVCLIGLFFNQVLPAVIGGDALRVWLLHRGGYALRAAINSIFLDRVSMLYVLFALLAATVPLLARQVDLHVPWWASGVLFAGASAGIGAIFYLNRFASVLPNRRLFRGLLYLSTDIAALLRDLGGLAAVLLLCLVSYLLFSVAIWLFAASLGAGLTLWAGILVVPTVVFASTLPISIGGWGVREGALALLLTSFGVTHDNAVTIALLFGFGTFLSTLPGAFAAMTHGWGRLRKVATEAAADPAISS
jgi:uncharacterized membrane protein YbhN (UPF0104 family)